MSGNDHRLMRRDLPDPPSVPKLFRAIPRPKVGDVLHRFHSTNDRYEQTMVQRVLELNQDGTQWQAGIGDPRREGDLDSNPQNLSKHHWVPASWVFDGVRGYWRDLKAEEQERKEIEALTPVPEKAAPAKAAK